MLGHSKRNPYTYPAPRRRLYKLAVYVATCLCFAVVLLFSGGNRSQLAGAALIPQGETIVRVALQTGADSAAFVVGHGAYGIISIDQGSESGAVSIGQRITVEASGSSLRVMVDGSALSFSGSRVLLSPRGSTVDAAIFGNRSYRGSMLVENRGGKLNTINILDVDEYLLGVLPMEMGLSTAPAEALKAQAVVSRTYALRNKRPEAAYDLVSGVSDQAYGGFGMERAYCTAAVEATKGQVIYYDGALIEAFFSSNGGGYTEDSENVWNEALPYARAVPSPHDRAALTWIQDSNGYPGNTYSWQLRFTLQELQEKIAQWNRENPDNRMQIGNLRSMNAYTSAFDPASRLVRNAPNASGRVTWLELRGSSGTFSLYKESIRSFLGLRSTLFSLLPQGGVAAFNGAGVALMLGQGIRESSGLVADGQPAEINHNSNSFFIVTANGVIEKSKDEASAVDAYVIDGKGYGHGVGMSQWGAIGMAEEGVTYGQIIEHYYNQGKNDGRLAIRTAQ